MRGGVRVWLAVGRTDMRRGIDGLSALVETVVKEAPGSGAIFGFRGKRADRIKLLWWDGQGFCLFYKVLERGYFPWPTAKEGVAHLTQAQMQGAVDTAALEGVPYLRGSSVLALAHTGDEALDDLEVHVRLEQRESDLAHRLRDRVLVEAALAAKVAERRLELV